MDGDLISRKAILEAIDKREEIVQKLTARGWTGRRENNGS